jgi:hypothetical protein
VVPPVLVPQGGGPWGGRSHRLRRSATPLSPRPIPAEMPDDTAGRVAFLSVDPAPDVRPDPPGETEAMASARPRPLLEGWTAVGLAAVLLIALFALGMGLLR